MIYNDIMLLKIDNIEDFRLLYSNYISMIFVIGLFLMIFFDCLF